MAETVCLIVTVACGDDINGISIGNICFLGPFCYCDHNKEKIKLHDYIMFDSPGYNIVVPK